MIYRKKIIEIYVFKWLGDESLIVEINKTLKIINKKYKDRGNFSVGLSQNDNTILGLTQEYSDGFEIYYTTSWTHPNEYVVLDLNEDVNPFRSVNETFFNKNYEKL